LFTAGGEFGTLKNITIERNRIYENGHDDYEDGIVVNGEDEGVVENLTIQRNLIYSNRYSGIRFAGPATSRVRVVNNTFHINGTGSRSPNRSEINIDDEGTAAGAVIERNIFVVANALINDCYDAASKDFVLRDNVLAGSAGTGATNCVTGLVRADPQFVDPSKGDYHTRNTAVAAYGAYAQ
jgi:hypothetical protein